MGKVIGFSNFADTIISYFKNEATAQRTYTFPDEDVTFTALDYSEGTWVPTYTGFSSAPTGVQARYVLIGRMCHITLSSSGVGTSNANTLTVTLPFAAANTIAQQAPCIVVDNNVILAMTRCVTAVNSNVLTVYATMTSSTAFTTSGNKNVILNMVYEIA